MNNLENFESLFGNKTLSSLKEKFYEPHRKYHNYNHINYCFNIFDKYFKNSNLSEEDKTAIKFALYFHDIIYDPSASDNEEKSCQTFQNIFADKLNYLTIDKISSYILATKTHKPFDYNSSIVIDCDLAILGSSAEEFVIYENSIREEYLFVPDEAFNLGRKVAMNKFANKEFIFATQELKNSKFEFRAKINLKKYL